MPSVTISDFKSLERYSLRGFCTVSLPSGMILHEVAIHLSNGAWWASPASRPQIGRDGTVLKGDDNKLKYTPIVSLDSKATRDRFSASVIDALKLAHPELFR
jgi:hypothetical protein